MRSARRFVVWARGRLTPAATLRLLVACVVLTAVCEGVAGAAGLQPFTALVKPVTHLPGVNVPPGTTGTPNGAGALRGSRGTVRPSVRVLARSATGDTVAGAAAPFFVIVSNSGVRSTTAGRPVVLTIHVPAGLSFAGATDLDRLPGLVGFAGDGRAQQSQTWSCRGVSSVRCELVQTGTSGSAAVSLPGRSETELLVTFRVASAFHPAAHGTLLASRFSIAAPGNIATTNTSAVADVTVANDLPRPQLFPDVGGSTTVVPGEPATETIEPLVVGSGSAHPSAGKPSIVLAHLLPAKLLGGWRASGSGWSCSGRDPSCSYRGTVPVGSLASRLTLSYTLDRAKVGALHLEPGGRNRVVQWTFTLNARGDSPNTTARFPGLIAVAAPAGSALMPQVLATGGIDELLPGTGTTLDLQLTNLGKAPTTGAIVLRGTIPEGIRVTAAFERGRGNALARWPCTTQPAGPRLQQFSCLSSRGAVIPAASSIELTMPVTASAGATARDGALTLQAGAANQIAGAGEQAASVPLIVLPGNVGFPSLTLSEGTGAAARTLALSPAVDGGPAALKTGGTFAERLDVRDAGGAPIPAGSQARLDQSFGPGVHLRIVARPPNWSCSTPGGPSPSLRCSVRFAAAVIPAAAIAGPTVAVTVTEPTAEATNWPASIRLTAPGAPAAARLPVLVTVTRSGPGLLPSVTTELVPTAGGSGRFALGVSNTGDATTRSRVRLSLRLPDGVRFERVGGLGWQCSAATSSAICVSSSRVAVGARLPQLAFAAGFRRRSGRRTLTIVAAASDGRAPAPRSAVAFAKVTPRPAVHASIKAPDTVALVDQPLVNPSAPLTPSTITLEGDGSGGSGLGLTYEWTQRCVTPADARAAGTACNGVTPRVSWLGQPPGTVRPSTANVAFRAPSVSRPATLVFELTVSDGSASASALVRIRDVPPTGTGFTFRHPHPGRMPASGPATEHRRLPAPAEHLLGTKRRSSRSAPAGRRNSPKRRAAADSGSLPQAFCDLVSKAVDSKSVSASFGPVSFALNNVTLSGSGCSASTTFSFSDSSLRLSSFLDASGVTGSVSKDGVTITAATIKGPESWHAPNFKLGGKGLSLPFGSGDSVEVAGSISGDGLAFVPLPAGWTATTTLDFSASSDATSISVGINGSGPAKDGSPDSQRPTLAIDGAIASDGTFSLNVALTRLVQLQGHSIDVTGSVVRSSADAPLKLKLTGKLSEGFDVVSGLRIDALSVSMAPSGDSLGLTGNGTILVTTGSSSVGVGIKFAYENPGNWSLRADGAGTASWEPLPGLTIKPQDISGAITATNDKYDFSLTIAPGETWRPATGVSVSKLKLSLSNTCPDTGAPCPKDASLFLDVAGDARFDLPSVGTISSNLRGTLALPGGAFSVAATLPKPIDIGGGISIDSGKIELSRGMPTPPGTALLADSGESNGLRLQIAGSATLPLVGKVPTVEAAFSSQGFSVAAQLGSFSLPGSSGEGSSLTDTVVGWSSFPTSLNVGGSKIELPKNTFEVSGSFDTPKWLKDLLKLPGDFHARATGSLNTGNGDFGLRVEITLPKTTYIYGDASSASSVRLSTVFVEVARRGADFNIALGGGAKLAIAATDSLPASSVDLGVALSIAPPHTVAGTLTVSSKDGWQSAFGVNGLTLFDLAVSFQLNLETGVPGLGFGASAVLPASIRDPLGIPDGVKTTLVANLSVTNPCLGVAITDPANSGQNVLDIEHKGVLTAKQFDVQIAPLGCDVGQFHYDPGLSVNFDGRIAGVSVAVKAHMGLTPFAISGSVDVGEFAVGGMNVQKTHIDLAITPSKFEINFSGGVTVLGTSVELSGGLKQAGATTTIDFHGKLDNLSFGNALTIKSVAVDAHVEIGPKPVLKFSAKGSIDLLGSTADAEFTLGLDNGALTQATAKVKAKVSIGGPSGVVLDGTFNLDYKPSSSFAIDASVNATVGSFRLGTATVSVRPTSLELSAELAYGDVFRASLAGAVYFGNVPKGTTIVGPNGNKVPATAGDFLLSAKDVNLNLAGFRANGTVELGRASGQIWGNVATRIQLLGSGGENSIAIAGSFNSGGDFSFTGSGNLNLVGVTAKLAVAVKRSGGSVTVHGDTTVSILGSNVSLAGDFQYDGGSPRVRLSGSGTLVLGGYRLADGSFFFSNFPSDAGLFANVHVQAGSVLDATGRLTIVGSRFYLGVKANLNLRLLSVQGDVTFTNCTDSSCRFGKSTTTLDAGAGVYYGGFSFGISAHISSDGSFSATAISPVSGEFYGRTGDVYIVAVAFYADFHYHMRLTVSSGSPYVSLSGSGGGNLYGKSWGYRGGWSWGWSGWGHIFGISASIETNPFKVCGGVSVWGVWFSACT